MFSGTNQTITIADHLWRRTYFIFSGAHRQDGGFPCHDHRTIARNSPTPTLSGSGRDYLRRPGNRHDKLEINSSSYIVIVTRGHQNDEQVLQWAAKTNAGYIGMIGSKRKIKTSYAYLKTKGITQEQLDRVHSPIGLAIGAETPEEIAVAIMAEIIQIRRQGTGIKPEV